MPRSRFRILLTSLLAVTGIAAVVATVRATSPQTQPAAIPGDDAYDWKKWSQFWAFQPVHKPQPPAVDGKWARNPIDAFILAKLKEKGLQPSPEADKLTLIRRATYDLLGLPPTPEEIRAFQADTSPDAYEKLIDRLLESPHYGQRWGRHWLDVARYVPGHVSFVGVKNTAGDSHYRDYVIRAFNIDKPYDRFVTEQLAGDLLPPTEDRQAYFDQIVAPAFLSIGSWFDMETDPNRLRLEMVDEMINTTTKAFMGISVSCARCHDHKFDPIPTQDYYALGGIFRSTKIIGELNEYWRDGRRRQLRPLALPEEVATNREIEKKADDLRAKRWSLLVKRHGELSSPWHAAEQTYRDVASKITSPFTLVWEAENFDGQSNLRIAQLRRGDIATDVIETLNPVTQWVLYRPQVPDTGKYRLEVLYSTDESNPVTITVNGEPAIERALTSPTGGFDPIYQRWGDVGTLDLRAGVNFVRLTLKNGMFPRLDRLRLVKVDAGAEQRITTLASENHLDARLLQRFVYWPQDPWPMQSDIEAFVSDADRAELKRLEDEATRLEATIKPYPLAVAVTDEKSPVDLPVYVRGQTYRPTNYQVPRGLPRFLDAALPRPSIGAGESGRLELAKWLTNPRNPLTSRVMVNRIWGWHFGRGIVDSPSDFGSRGSQPSHPELLDWLASKFVEQGWSIKKMHRLIMTSATYRQSAKSEVGSMKSEKDDQRDLQTSDFKLQTSADPDDRLFWRFPPRRLEAEALYDAMLSTTNALPRQTSGPLEFAKSKNRAMYTLTAGTSPTGLGVEVRKMLTLFDVEMTGQPVEARRQSATPAQSLFWLNSPLVKYFADKFAERLLKMDKLSDAKRVEMMYLLAVGHPPSKAITEQSLAFLKQCHDDGDEPKAAWAKLCQAVYASAEFRYVE